MSIRQFLARQRASFVLAKDFIGEITQTHGCTQQEAAKTIDICLQVAGENAPKWHSDPRGGMPYELTDAESLRNARVMLAALTRGSANRIWDPEADIDTAAEAAKQNDPFLLHLGVRDAYRSYGFKRSEIVALVDIKLRENAENSVHLGDHASRAAVAVPVRWPWGDHETVLLQHLAAAAEKFWARYDATDPTTAPTNEEVGGWLQGRGVSESMSKRMATILRPDGLPTGPRVLR